MYRCPECQNEYSSPDASTGESSACPSCGAGVPNTDIDGETYIPTDDQRSQDKPQSYLGGTSGDPQFNPKQFGDYEIEQEIARGGMGVVFKARQLSLNRQVALKMILNHRLASPDDVQRFYNEAELAAKLDHHGIVPVYDVGSFEGQHFLSLGFVDGAPLASLTKNGPVSNWHAAELVQQIAQAIQYAHTRNIVHRDLKPGNVLLDAEGHPKVTDFGLAKSLEQDSGLTATGAVLGTPSYMAPEQASGKLSEVGPLADVYALGGILYFLLTTQPPFRGANHVETIRQVIDQDPQSPRELNKKVDLDLSTICLKCLEKDPAQRYASASELAEELELYLQGKPIKARPIGNMGRIWRWCRRNPAMAMMVSLVVFSAVVLFVSNSGGRIVDIAGQAGRAFVSPIRTQNNLNQIEKAVRMYHQEYRK